MWHVTFTTNGELVETKEFKALDINHILGVYKLIGYEEDEFFTMPEWGRYYLQKWTNGVGLCGIAIEKEEEV